MMIEENHRQKGSVLGWERRWWWYPDEEEKEELGIGTFVAVMNQ